MKGLMRELHEIGVAIINNVVMFGLSEDGLDHNETVHKVMRKALDTYAHHLFPVPVHASPIYKCILL